MARLCEGKIAIVTGAGRGIGREHALSLARHGAKVVVNDLGGARDGTGDDVSPAQQVVDEIVAGGGAAVVNADNVADWDGAQRMVETAIETFGGLDAVVNNAGILRDRMLANMTEDEWDAVINVHLKGTFAPARHAAAYWRERSKAGDEVAGRIINTTSVSGIYGNVGQSNYGAAKAGIASFTQITAMELARYGVTVNAVAPVALTRMTEDLGPAPETPDECRGAVAEVDRADRHVARFRRSCWRHRSSVRGVRRVSRGRRRLGPRSEHGAGRRSRGARRDRPVLAC